MRINSYVLLRTRLHGVPVIFGEVLESRYNIIYNMLPQGHFVSFISRWCDAS